MKMSKRLMKDTSNPGYERYARQVKQFEAEYGEKWDGTRVENNNLLCQSSFLCGQGCT